MIIQQNYREIETAGDVLETSKMHVSREAESHLIRMATEWSYKSPLESGLREAVSNAIDSHIEAGVEEPVIVRLQKNKAQRWVLEIIDKGLGLDDVGFDKYIMGIGESTKRGNANLLGGYGAGAKAFISYVDNYDYVIVKDGIKRKYVIAKGEEIPERLLIYEKKTEEVNGVTVSVALNDNYGEFENCIRAIKEQLSYLDNIYYDIPGFDNTFKIFKSESFQWNSLHPSKELHISLKGIYYPINWSKLGISRIDIPIALRFEEYDFLQPVFNREELIWNSKSREGILVKLKQVADWFGKKYNEGIVEFDNFPQAFKHLYDSQKFVELEGTKFYVDSLEKYMSFQLEDIKVKGIENPRQCFITLNDYTFNFHTIGMVDWRGAYKSKHLYTYIREMMIYKYQGILLDQHPVGRVRDYIKQKYAHNTYFLLEAPLSLKEYKNMLKLDRFPKDKWRGMIKQIQELQKQIKENFLSPLFNIRETKEFLEFEAEQKAIAKANREEGIETPGYKTLDKQEGEVTIALARPAAIGSNPVFEKDTYVIEDLPRSSYIMVLFNEEDKEEAKNYFGLHKHLKVGIVGKRERTKLPDIHQIMTKEKFEKTKLFKRIVTAIRADDVLHRWIKITDSSEGIVEDCLGKISDKLESIELYRQENLLRNSLSREVKDSFMALAHEHSLWDMEILHEIIALEKALDTFYFVQYIEYPRYGSEEDKRRVKKMINQLLIYQKKFGNLENYELVPVAQLEEQKELEEEFLNTPEAEMCLA